ncbi:MAG: hypothetical protein Q7T50_05470, partial [Candidatus Magasanikbacteria bacterium]|nr:hypothetical protein [Candidatus Magasanikbacteria bacterium]
MDFHKLKNFKKGWILGDFEPSIFRVKHFEVCIKRYDAGYIDNPHFHKVAKEITVIISGKFKIDAKIAKEGDIFVIYPNSSIRFVC